MHVILLHHPNDQVREGLLSSGSRTWKAEGSENKRKPWTEPLGKKKPTEGECFNRTLIYSFD